LKKHLLILIKAPKIAMLKEQYPSKPQRIVGWIALFAYLISPAYQAIGATLSLGIDNSLISNLPLGEDEETWQLIPGEILVSDERLNSINLIDSNFSLGQSQADEANGSLSMQSIINSFNRLRLDSNGQSDQEATVPILPQVRYSDVDKGVYVFEPTSTRQIKPPNIFLFEANTIKSAISIPKIPKVEVNVGMQKMGLKVPQFDSLLSLIPKKDVTKSIEDVDPNSLLTEFNNVLNQKFGDLKIDIGFSLLPQTIIPTPLDLQDNFLKTSNLIRTDLEVIPALQTEIEERVQRQIEQQYASEKQRAQIAQLLREEQERQQQIESERLERLKERQQEQLERQLEKQQKQKEKLQDYLQKQMERQKK
jgi:hypothetical protein